MPYIKLKNEAEYTVSEDGLNLLYRHIPSSVKDWIKSAAIPSGLRIVDFREISGANIEMLMTDDRWYHLNMHGFITLTDREKEKDRQAEKAAREEEKRREEEEKAARRKEYDRNRDDDSYSSSYSSSTREREEDKEEGYCFKFIFTIIPILLIWWIIKIPFSLITYPFRLMCSSDNKSLLPSYSFKKF